MKLYRDGERYIIGPDMQSSHAYSMTEGYAEAYSKREAKLIIEKLSTLSKEELASRLRNYNTWDRFEDACDEGKFGPAW